MAIDYGTTRLVRGGATVNPAPVAPLAKSLAATSPYNPSITPGLVTPAGAPPMNVTQPTRQLNFSATPPAPPPSNLPPTNTTSQSGQGGGQSTIPGPAQGQPTQAGGTGAAPVTRSTNMIPSPPPNLAGGPAVAITPRSGGIPAAPMDQQTRPTTPPGTTVPADPNAGGMNYTPSLPGQVADGGQWTQGDNLGAPNAPTGGSTTPFATHFTPSGNTAFSRTVGQNFGKYGQAAVDQANLPSSFSVADFNKVAQSNPTLAVQMAGQGGQAFKDEIMKSNNWTNLQMNRFINQHGSGVEPGITRQGLNQAGFAGQYGNWMLAPPQAGGQAPGSQPSSQPPPAPGQPGPYAPNDPYWAWLYQQTHPQG